MIDEVAPSIRNAAEQLFAQHQARRSLADVADDFWPSDLPAAYAVQDHLQQLYSDAGHRIAGWKVALTTPVMQALVGIDHPCEGAIFADRVHQDQAMLQAADFVNIGVESEIAVRLGRGLGADGTPYDREGVADAVAACMAAIEIVDDRAIDYKRLNAPLLVADNAFNFGCVLGPEVAEWRDLDLAALGGRMVINEATVGEGVGADVLGHPLEALAWLANSLARRGRPLQAGQIVMTGSIVATKWLKAGDNMATQIDGLGEARLRLS